MLPEEVLNAQEELLWFSQQKTFQRYVGGVVGSAESVFMEDHDPVRNPRHRTWREDGIARQLTKTMPSYAKSAYAYRVTGDMCTVLEYAAGQLDETDTFDRNMAPSGTGFVRFEKPLPVSDARGRKMLVHYMLWGPAAMVVQNDSGEQIGTRYGVCCCMFNDHIENPDDYATQVLQDEFMDPQGRRLAKNFLASVGRWGFIGVDMIEQNEVIGRPVVETDARSAAFILEDGDIPHPHTNTKRYLYALWMLLNQTLTTVKDEYARKTAVKRAKRVGLPGTVTVIDLRRTASNRQPGETMVEWSHRWIVSGHWRWQPYGARKTDHLHHYGAAETEGGLRIKRCTHEGCDARQERIYIGMYDKGPEDKPLIVTKKVYNLRR